MSEEIYTDQREIEIHCKAFDQGYEKGQIMGLKAGLEVAKDICKREGYDFQFPDPEKIKIKQDDANCVKCEVKV